ncbi:GNAT family N-acetyltransferase [Flavobacterium sediminilitoris]|uniref:GNAT family N-acetyltransferase n=1 Tax=Flavobacterium sediminilitoris TaxID=2024526 RepID=A0ABY4HSN1_9FLAO|nr:MULTISPECIES: GNAT family N-acetyltransferase [Flavobacterium]UOX35558.1 GNAT family N-acetyltransferase [Flavobacterium sediminilitoris]
MKIQTLQIDKLTTERLILIPYTIQICENIINKNFSNLFDMGLKRGKSWPDNDVIETLPKIINNLSQVESPTGFESWMIIKKETLEIIGDLGFKGYNHKEENIDIGYGIIEEERRNGYAEEATKELIKWAFSTGLIKEITAKCLIENTGSINLIKKLNFIEAKRDHEMIYWTLQNRYK